MKQKKTKHTRHWMYISSLHNYWHHKKVESWNLADTLMLVDILV